MAADIVLAALLLLGAPPAGKPEAPASYVWHDGDRQRTVWLDPSRIAEFGALDAPRPAGTKAEARTGETSRLWQIDKGHDLEEVLSNARKASPANRFSPVLQDAQASGRRRALPGNVIVVLGPGFEDEGTAGTWAEKRGLELLSRVNVGKSTWLIESDPGLAALDLANSLVGTPGVVSASPVWWTETATR